MNIDKILRDKEKPLKIRANIELSKAEISYLKNNGRKLIESILWKSYTNNPNYDVDLDQYTGSFAQNQRLYQDKVKVETDKALVDFNKQVKTNKFPAYIELSNEAQPIVNPNTILEVIFSTFSPNELGIIDYHGAHRTYQKENISNLNVNLNNDKDSYKGHTLYNYANKYNNVKNEMASSYVKALISRESGEEDGAIDSLNQSLDLLFLQFFPDKKFKGITPTKNGLLEFPVELSTGETHDIGELSSGEKEVLFGYLRLKNQAPKNSIILIDEPELHLNPKLARKLPEFYYKSIGLELNNQIWLVTHSEAILKESVGSHDFSIYHMGTPDPLIPNQVREISISKDIEATIIDLIGDLSSFRQGHKVVIFEGIESEFDKKFTNSLFPEFEKTTNSISAGAKNNVKNLQSILKKASDEGVIDKEFISIVDKDSYDVIEDLTTSRFSWDVYHIENYLLNGDYILKVLNDLDLVNKNINTSKKIISRLKSFAKKTIDFHVKHQLNDFVSSELKKCITTKIANKGSYGEEYSEAVVKSLDNISSKSKNELSSQSIECKQKSIENELVLSLKTENWKKEFRGRSILKLFVGEYAKGMRYELFRNLIISQMAKENHQPEGMKIVINKILKKK